MTPIVVTDPEAAYCAFLRASVGDMLSPATNPASGVTLPAVFRPDLPKWFDGEMPGRAIVVRAAGGNTMFGRSRLHLSDPRLDVICYGTVAQEAVTIARTVAVVSKQLQNEVWESTLLACANVSGGPVPLPDQQTVWPGAWLSVQLVHGELPQPANAA